MYKTVAENKCEIDTNRSIGMLLYFYAVVIYKVLFIVKFLFWLKNPSVIVLKLLSWLQNPSVIVLFILVKNKSFCYCSYLFAVISSSLFRSPSGSVVAMTTSKTFTPF